MVMSLHLTGKVPLPDGILAKVLSRDSASVPATSFGEVLKAEQQHLHQLDANVAQPPAVPAQIMSQANAQPTQTQIDLHSLELSQTTQIVSEDSVQAGVLPAKSPSASLPAGPVIEAADLDSRVAGPGKTIDILPSQAEPDLPLESSTSNSEGLAVESDPVEKHTARTKAASATKSGHKNNSSSLKTDTPVDAETQRVLSDIAARSQSAAVRLPVQPAPQQENEALETATSDTTVSTIDAPPSSSKAIGKAETPVLRSKDEAFAASGSSSGISVHTQPVKAHSRPISRAEDSAAQMPEFETQRGTAQGFKSQGEPALDVDRAKLQPRVTQAPAEAIQSAAELTGNAESTLPHADRKAPAQRSEVAARPHYPTNVGEVASPEVTDLRASHTQVTTPPGPSQEKQRSEAQADADNQSQGVVREDYSQSASIAENQKSFKRKTPLPVDNQQTETANARGVNHQSDAEQGIEASSLPLPKEPANARVATPRPTVPLEAKGTEPMVSEAAPNAGQSESAPKIVVAQIEDEVAEAPVANRNASYKATLSAPVPAQADVETSSESRPEEIKPDQQQTVPKVQRSTVQAPQQAAENLKTEVNASTTNHESGSDKTSKVISSVADTDLPNQPQVPNAQPVANRQVIAAEQTARKEEPDLSSLVAEDLPFVDHKLDVAGVPEKISIGRKGENADFRVESHAEVRMTASDESGTVVPMDRPRAEYARRINEVETNSSPLGTGGLLAEGDAFTFDRPLMESASSEPEIAHPETKMAMPKQRAAMQPVENPEVATKPAQLNHTDQAISQTETRSGAVPTRQQVSSAQDSAVVSQQKHAPVSTADVAAPKEVVSFDRKNVAKTNVPPQINSSVPMAASDESRLDALTDRSETEHGHTAKAVEANPEPRAAMQPVENHSAATGENRLGQNEQDISQADTRLDGMPSMQQPVRSDVLQKSAEVSRPEFTPKSTPTDTEVVNSEEKNRAEVNTAAKPMPPAISGHDSKLGEVRADLATETEVPASSSFTSMPRAALAAADDQPDNQAGASPIVTAGPRMSQPVAEVTHSASRPSVSEKESSSQETLSAAAKQSPLGEEVVPSPVTQSEPAVSQLPVNMDDAVVAAEKQMDRVPRSELPANDAAAPSAHDKTFTNHSPAFTNTEKVSRGPVAQADVNKSALPRAMSDVPTPARAKPGDLNVEPLQTNTRTSMPAVEVSRPTFDVPASSESSAYPGSSKASALAEHTNLVSATQLNSARGSAVSIEDTTSQPPSAEKLTTDSGETIEREKVFAEPAVHLDAKGKAAPQVTSSVQTQASPMPNESKAEPFEMNWSASSSTIKESQLGRDVPVISVSTSNKASVETAKVTEHESAIFGNQTNSALATEITFEDVGSQRISVTDSAPAENSEKTSRESVVQPEAKPATSRQAAAHVQPQSPAQPNEWDETPLEPGPRISLPTVKESPSTPDVDAGSQASFDKVSNKKVIEPANADLEKQFESVHASDDTVENENPQLVHGKKQTQDLVEGIEAEKVTAQQAARPAGTQAGFAQAISVDQGQSPKTQNELDAKPQEPDRNPSLLDPEEAQSGFDLPASLTATPDREASKFDKVSDRAGKSDEVRTPVVASIAPEETTPARSSDPAKAMDHAQGFSEPLAAREDPQPESQSVHRKEVVFRADSNLEATDPNESSVSAASGPTPLSESKEIPSFLQADNAMKTAVHKEDRNIKQTASDDEALPSATNVQESKEPAVSVPTPGNPVNLPESVDAISQQSSVLRNTGTQADNITEQIARELKVRLRRGSNSMHLQLNPTELGAIDVEMVSGPVGISVTFVAEQASTGKLLEGQMDQLRQSLIDSGVQLSGLNISQHGQPGPKGGSAHPNTSFAPYSQRSEPRNETHPKETSRIDRTHGQSGEIDYLI